MRHGLNVRTTMTYNVYVHGSFWKPSVERNILFSSAVPTKIHFYRNDIIVRTRKIVLLSISQASSYSWFSSLEIIFKEYTCWNTDVHREYNMASYSICGYTTVVLYLDSWFASPGWNVLRAPYPERARI